MGSFADKVLHQDGGDENSKVVGENFGVNPPSMVFFPDAIHRRIELAPLKLEVEESAEDMSPQNMWQVYILGGFMFARWVWARWRERTRRSSKE
ncbi:hypothetical protein AXF42_Ash020418 [Apostasia shenzhenica]|uniref:Uncharacterized protein n=1 Tax=Apostasia shenzhenica TaxID=1088818 RepID=A0A2I0AA85_9ASPA|nr:hypothetical protein AXF42_Ash020418 [Apostasia shenzhenica]